MLEPKEGNTQGLLSGVAVVDMTRHIAGPYCAQMLGDMGADVVKVESLRGDDTRQEEPIHDGTSVYYMNYNRNKRSISIDFRSPHALRVLEPLVAGATVLLQNFRPGVMDQMGLSERRIRDLSPSVVYVSVSGFGSKGPYAKLPAFDEVLQAMSGLMALTGPAGGSPTLVGVPIIDTLTAVYALAATMSGLYYRQRTGIGQTIEVNLYGAALSAVNPSITRFVADGIEDRQNGNRNRYEAGINTYATADGFVHLVAYADAHWSKIAARIDGPGLVSDPRYLTIEARARRMDEIDTLIASWMRSRTTADVMQVMAEDGVPCGEVRTISQVARDPELVAAERLVSLTHPNGEELPFLAMPVEFSRTPQTVRWGPPAIGEHSWSVLTEVLGLSESEATNLINLGVVGTPAPVEA